MVSRERLAKTENSIHHFPVKRRGRKSLGLRAVSTSTIAVSIGQFTGVEAVTRSVARGGLLAFRPLLIHASDAAKEPGSRRVIQLDFRARELPLPLE